MTNSQAARVGLISVKAPSKLVMNQTSLFKWGTQRDWERLHLKVPPHQFFCGFFLRSRTNRTGWKEEWTWRGANIWNIYMWLWKNLKQSKFSSPLVLVKMSTSFLLVFSHNKAAGLLRFEGWMPIHFEKGKEEKQKNKQKKNLSLLRY